MLIDGTHVQVVMTTAHKRIASDNRH